MSLRHSIIRSATVSKSIIFFSGFMRFMRDRGYEMVALSSPGKELESLQRDGFRCIGIPMQRHISLVKDIGSLVRLICVFIRERPKIVHSMTPKAGLLCMLAAFFTGVPIRIHTFTGLVWPTSTGLKRRVLILTDWLTCVCATHIIPEGEGVKNDLIAGNITKKPLKVLGYGNVKGVDMQLYSRRPEVIRLMEGQKLNDNSVFTFLFVGRIVKDKGINELVFAFDRLQKEYKAVRLLLVGPYEDHLDPISAASRQLIEDNSAISNVGVKTGEELLAYYCASDCFVMPSYREGFPNTVLEAGAMDLPSIVTDINGSREIIVNGENGIIIPSRDEERLYKAMKFMLTSRQECQRMAGNARKMIADRFEQGFVRKCLYDFYDEVMAEKS